MQRQLLGPTGAPVSDQHNHRKVPIPVEGEQLVPRWAHKDKAMYDLPGGGALQFDLSQLELRDFRTMRDHYQIGANLALLRFMIHQAAFKVEGPNTPERIRKFIDDQLHDIWPQLVKAHYPSLWAGFSGSILQWENDGPSGRVLLSKVKDLEPEEVTINWREVDGWQPDPGQVPPKIRVFDGLKVSGHSQPIPPENCVHPDTKILCADYQWRRAGDLEVGDKLVAVEEHDSKQRGGRGGRRFVESVVEASKLVEEESVEVSTDLGPSITVTSGHPFLVRRRRNSGGHRRDTTTGRMLKSPPDTILTDHWAWVDASELKEGDEIAFFAKPWAEDLSRSAGWLSGMYDGEGSCSNRQLAVSQREGAVLDRLMDELEGRNFGVCVGKRKADTVRQLNLRGGMPEVMRLFGEVGSIRLGPKYSAQWPGTHMKINKNMSLASVTSVQRVGVQPICRLQTSSRTYISEGYVSHNCFYYAMLAEGGNYNGRKLLRPAFPPFFFSQVMHLFTNRYYQRFGEPVPIARGDFNQQFAFEDGSTQNGYQVLETAVRSLQSGAAVIFPNDRAYDPGSGASSGDWAYQLSYLDGQMKGADFERYLSRLDEEISLALFTPFLLFRTADVGSYNLGEAHMQVFLWMVSSMLDDFGQWVDRYIIRRMVDFNFGPNAGLDLRFTARKMGQEAQATLRAIAQSVIQSERAMPDLDDLGEALNMKFTKTTPSDQAQASGNGSAPSADGIRPGTTSPEMSVPA